MKEAFPLSEELGPTGSGVCPEDCPHKDNGFCADHSQMERSRIYGMAALRFGTWFVGVAVVVLIGVLSYFSTRVDTVEGKVTQHIEGSNAKLDQIHHSVMTMEFNLRHDMTERGVEYTDLKFKEEY